MKGSSVYDVCGSTSNNWVGWPEGVRDEWSDGFGRRHLAGEWRTPQLIRVRNEHHRIAPVGDIPTHQNGRVTIFSARAVHALRDLIEPAAEILPVESDLGEYYAINVLARVDALIVEDSKMSRLPSGRVFMIHRYAFDPTRLNGPSLFRIPQWDVPVFCDDVFMERMNAAGLEQLRVPLIWSVETGPLSASLFERIRVSRKRRKQK